ncbi:uncharacterized protein LOC123554108 isoform X2 [Mercenaria mercenaria]|uniref:uncharacterized protein LOC123554108 isoform X2 n=1 Tax=Mercenaria mercenaria TaxID=6596 RepID=UPI00234E6403|nr:uncharacterized protein LOC123554108 isoform X2 [Mercenaria mercenaria]
MSTKQNRKRQKVQKGSNSSDTEDPVITMAASADVNNKKGSKKGSKPPTSVPNSVPPGVKTVSNSKTSANSPLNSTMSPHAASFVFPMSSVPPNPFGVIQSPSSNPTQHSNQDLSLKLDNVLSKLSKLETIESQQTLILSRLTTIEADIATNRSQISETKSQIQDVTNSQTFVCGRVDDMLKTTDSHEKNLKKLQGELKVLTEDNKKLHKQNKQLQEDVTDVRCRSMRDNLVMLGISEHPFLLQDSTGGAPSVPLHQPSEPSGGSSMDTSSSATGSPATTPLITTGTGTAATAGSPSVSDPTTGSYAAAAAPEDCAEKVYVFCEKILKITNARSRIHINRAHRSPTNRIPGKTRPIICNFDTDSKQVIKQALKNVSLKSSNFAVFDQLPKDVQARRKELVPKMVQARADGHTAYLVRDKLYINNVLYCPDPDPSST